MNGLEKTVLLITACLTALAGTAVPVVEYLFVVNFVR